MNKKYTYSDPTGGGDDVEISLPAWVDPPEDLMFRETASREAHYFTLEDEDGEDDDDFEPNVDHTED